MSAGATDRIAAATPPDRDRYADLVRAASIVAVVVGHWLVAGVSWDGERLRETSTLGQVPAMWPVSWLLQVIPLFFFVAGFANGRGWERARARGEGYPSFIDRRMQRVLVPTLAFLVCLAVVVAVYRISGATWIGEGAPLLTQPLWFLGVYLVVVALTPATMAAHRRWGPAVILALGLVVIVADTGRVGFDLEWAGYLNVLAVWVLFYQLGYLYADGALGPRVGAAMAIGGLLVAGLLVAFLPYPARMVGVGGDRIANMNPPTVALTALGVGQIGLVVMARRCLVGPLQRPRVWAWVVRVNLAIMTLYLWHQAALIATVRVVLPAGYPDPAPAGPDWWAARIGLMAAAGCVVVALVVLLGRFERIGTPPPRPAGPGLVPAAIAAVLVASLGLLGLAGTSFVDVLDAQTALGLAVSPLTSALLVAIAPVVARATSRGAAAAARSLAVAAVVLMVTAFAYAAGIGVPASSHAAILAACFALVLGGSGAASLVVGTRAPV